MHDTVGNMFLAIDEPSNAARTSNSDLSSIVYKEELDVSYKPRNHAKQQAVNGTAGEDEIRMEVKKEVERINKHSKPTKPVEGKGPTVASAKKADIIRQEIMNLKEKESRKVSSQEKQEITVRIEASDEKEAVQDKLPVDAEEQEDMEISNEDHRPQVELTINVEEKNEVIEAVEDNLEESVDVSLNERKAEVELEHDTYSLEDEADSGISVEDYIKQLQAQEADVPVEEYIAQMKESGVVAEEKDVPEDSEKQDVILTVKDSEKVEEETSPDKLESVQVNIQDVDSQYATRENDDDSDGGAGDDDIAKREENEEGLEIEDKVAQAESPAGMIPAKQQRMLMDAVLSLDYTSDSDTETDDADEICHYAKIERPSTPDSELSSEGRGIKSNDDDAFNVIIDAPPEFNSMDDGGHQTYSRIREHNIQYGATQGGKPVVHHVFMKSGQLRNVEEDESKVKQAKESPDKEEAVEEDRSQEDSNGEEESCVETIIEEKRLEVTETELQLDLDQKQARMLHLSYHHGLTLLIFAIKFRFHYIYMFCN